MLLTLTPNPALDRVLTVPGFRDAEICRVAEVREYAGGKGLNVTRAAGTLGIQVRAIAPLGGMVGQRVAHLAESSGMDGRWLWLAEAETRTCLLVSDPEAPDTLTMNERGPHVTVEEWAALAALVQEEAATAEVVACSGSLPPGVQIADFSSLLGRLAQTGVHLVLDTSGQALAAALTVPLHTLKANGEEFSAAVGAPIDSVEAALAALHVGAPHGPRHMLVTLGATGALLIEPGGAWLASPPPVRALSTVGSGDATTAGYCAGLLRGASLPEALRLAVACGTANTLALGPAVFQQEHVAEIAAQVRIERVA